MATTVSRGPLWRLLALDDVVLSFDEMTLPLLPRLLVALVTGVVVETGDGVVAEESLSCCWRERITDIMASTSSSN